MFEVSEKWHETWPGAVVGAMVMENLDNPPLHTGLEQLKTDFEAALRRNYAAYTRSMLEQLPSIRPYVDYYRRFNKSYHVLFQLESLVQKGKDLPRVAALVEAMFMAELKNQLLTAGHDYRALSQPLKLDVAGGGESYIQLNGKEQALKAADMFVGDRQGVISSIIYGPDLRTPIVPATRKALFVVYAPAGIGLQRVEAHLEDIRHYIEIVSPLAQLTALEMVSA